jgi:hypothetical protein
VGRSIVILDPTLARARFERDTRALGESPDNYAKIGIRVIRVEYPVLEVGLLWTAPKREIILHVDAEDYDYLPARGWWVDVAGSALQAGSGGVPNGGGFQTSGHPHDLPRTWFCFQGWREYHDHQSHQTPTWASIRQSPQHRLPGVVVQLHADLNKPGVQAV